MDAVVFLADGRRLGYAEYGPPDGPAMFYLHGWPGSRYQGMRLDGAAWALGLRVIAPERPGYGLSQPAPSRSMLDVSRDVVALADALAIERFAVFGASGGGPYALACALAAPKRLTAVAVANSLAPLDADRVAQAYPRRQRLLAGVALRSPRALAAVLHLVAARVRRDPHAVLARAVRRLPPVDRAVVSRPEVRRIAALDIQAALGDGGAAATRDALLLGRPWGFHVSRIEVPVHLWYGGADTIVRPACGAYLARAIPHCEARFYPHDGHYLMIPRADEILRAIG